MEILPQDLIQQIQDYIPRDSNYRSPLSRHIKTLLYYYNDCDYEEISRLIREWEEQHGLDDVNPRYEYDTELFYKPFYNEPFYQYALKIYRQEKQSNYNPSFSDSDSDSDSDWPHNIIYVIILWFHYL